MIVAHREAGPWRRALVVALLAALAALLLVAVASMLRPRVEDRSSVAVGYDPRGSMAQPFKAYGLEGWLVRQADGGVRAFSAADPRFGCRVEFIPVGHPLYSARRHWAGLERGMFVDRCMHSFYAADGKRLYGPAPRGLDEFEVQRVLDGRVYLDLTRVQRGDCGERVSSTGHCSLPGRPRFGRPAPVDEGYTSRFPWPVRTDQTP